MKILIPKGSVYVIVRGFYNEGIANLITGGTIALPLSILDVLAYVKPDKIVIVLAVGLT